MSVSSNSSCCCSDAARGQYLQAAAAPPAGLTRGSRAGRLTSAAWRARRRSRRAPRPRCPAPACCRLQLRRGTGGPEGRAWVGGLRSARAVAGLRMAAGSNSGGSSGSSSNDMTAAVPQNRPDRCSTSPFPAHQRRVRRAQQAQQRRMRPRLRPQRRPGWRKQPQRRWPQQPRRRPQAGSCCRLQGSDRGAGAVWQSLVQVPSCTTNAVQHMLLHVTAALIAFPSALAWQPAPQATGQVQSPQQRH